MSSNNNGPNVVNQEVVLTYMLNGVRVEYSFKFTDDTSPITNAEYIDQLVNAIKYIGAQFTDIEQPAQGANGSYRAKCDNCGDIGIVGFKPKANKPFYCDKCYKALNNKKGL